MSCCERDWVARVARNSRLTRRSIGSWGNHLSHINPQFCSALRLSLSDLTKLAVNGKVEKDGNTLSVSRPILPDVETSADGLRGFVRFTVDESDPRSKPPVQAER
jgi:hypothetical protein